MSRCIESTSSTGFITIDVDLHHLGTGVFNFLAVLGLRFCKGFLSLQRVGSTPHRGAETSRCGDFSYGEEALGCTGFSSCGIGVGFFTTELPGKSERFVLETQFSEPGVQSHHRVSGRYSVRLKVKHKLVFNNRFRSVRPTRTVQVLVNLPEVLEGERLLCVCGR